MTRTHTRIALGGALAMAAMLATAGCSATGSMNTAVSAPHTRSASASSTPSATDSATPDSSASNASGSGSGSSGSGSAGSGTGTSSGTTTLRSGQCASPDLGATVNTVAGGGSAGHTELQVVLQNHGEHSCTLQGWPGVSFVGQGNGTQLGAAATLDRQSPHGTVTLAPDGTAHALLQVADDSAYGTSCGAVTPDGFRVYPPGEKRSLFAPRGALRLTACDNPKIQLLDVQAFQPGS